MIAPDVRTVLDSTALAHLATVLPDGSPHAVPLWVGTHGDHIVFLTGPDSRKARNLRRDPRVALSLTGLSDERCIWSDTPSLARGKDQSWTR